MISFQGCDGIELLDWLFDQNDGILRHEETGRHGNHHTWPIQDPNVCEPVGSLIAVYFASTIQFVVDILFWSVFLSHLSPHCHPTQTD